MLKKTLLALVLSSATAAFALPFSSQHALVFEEESGKILLEKNASSVVPIASLTKLMTAMVVLDAGLDMNELISIEESDVDTLKFSSSRVPVGAILTREALLKLALMSSDNRAAAALARTYPGGNQGFLAAVNKKLAALGMTHTQIAEPTGLSPHNRSTAADLVKMATAAADYPEITRMSTEAGDLMDINGKPVEYRNTNRLVGRDGWDILLSKTGFTREAGRCLIMRLQSTGKNVIVVLLNAQGSAQRLLDAENIRRFLVGEPVRAVASPTRRASITKIKTRAPRGKVIRAKMPVKPQKARKKRGSV